MGFSKISYDKVHDSFTTALKDHNIWFKDLAAAGDGMTDLLCGKSPDKMVFLEAKSDMRYSDINKSQLVFMASTPAFVGIASTPEDAVKIALEPEKYCLTQKEKDKIQFWLDFKSEAFFAFKKDKKKRVTLLQFFVDILGRKDFAKNSREKTSMNKKIKAGLEKQT